MVLRKDLHIVKTVVSYDYEKGNEIRTHLLTMFQDICERRKEAAVLREVQVEFVGQAAENRETEWRNK